MQITYVYLSSGEKKFKIEFKTYMQANNQNDASH